MRVCHLDIESYSEAELTTVGAYKYAEDPSTEILCFGFAFDDDEVRQWTPGNPLPEDLVAHIEAGGELRCHNASFERVVLNGVAGQKIGFPHIRVEQTVCTAVKAAANGIPRSLAEGAKALGTAPKDDSGRIPMLQCAKPRKPTKADPSTRWTLENAPEKFAALYAYNLDDVKAERELDNALPDIDANEQRLYCLDQVINDRGWRIDIEAVGNILFVVELYKAQLAVQCEELTRDWLTGEGLKPTQREKIADWVRANGFPGLVDMTADYIRSVVLRDDVPEIVKRLLRIYSTYGAKATSKLQTMLDMVCADGRLHGMFMFYGAATGRWSSTGVQLQNLARGWIKDPGVAIEAFAARNIEFIQFLYPGIDLMKVAGSCIRGCLIGAPGTDLVAPDYSGVEDRVNAWFFDEQWVLDSYRTYDAGKGRHLYSITACRTFGIDLATFSDEDPRRQYGKVQRLALNYEGGAAAFSTMAETYGINLNDLAKVVLPSLPPEALDHAAWMQKNHPTKDMSDEQAAACNGLKYLWRQQHPNIVQGWKNLKEAAEKAVEFEGQAFWLPNRKIAFRVEEYRGRKWLCMRLPSGRKVKYYDPKWTPPRESERWINNELVPYTVPGFMDYMGVDTYTRQWMRLQTYGGKLDENADQAFSRDLLCNAALALDAAGYSIVGTEHDKVILEVPEKFGSVDEIKKLMLTQPGYAAGLPLATDGKRMRRYGK
jgi:DNA polymerase